MKKTIIYLGLLIGLFFLLYLAFQAGQKVFAILYSIPLVMVWILIACFSLNKADTLRKISIWLERYQKAIIGVAVAIYVIVLICYG